MECNAREESDVSIQIVYILNQTAYYYAHALHINNKYATGDEENAIFNFFKFEERRKRKYSVSGI